jgi:hypothetical protein
VSWARNENLAYFAKRTRVEHVLAEMCMVSLLNMDIWCKLHKEASGIILLGFIKICGIDLHLFAGVCTLLFLYLEYLIPWSIINNYYLGVQLSSVFMRELVLNVDYVPHDCLSCINFLFLDMGICKLIWPVASLGVDKVIESRNLYFSGHVVLAPGSI